MLRILKVKLTTHRDILLFGFLVLKGEERLELLKTTECLKVILIGLGKKTKGWLSTLNEVLKLLEDIKNGVRSLTHRSFGRIPRCSEEQIVILSGYSGSNKIFRRGRWW